jgi:NADH dehydrogenase [ubiquinone] 1 alpha subcomplex assembly factor 6
MDDYAYCAAQVRDYDSDRYVAALFAPASRRGDLLALYAFNLELARSRETVSQPVLGRIRLQWWRDVVAESYAGTARRHQVAQPLAAAIERHGLSRDLLDGIIDAREHDHDPEPAESTGDMLAYASATSGGLNRLALEILGVRDPEVHGAADRLGTAWALAGMARGLRHLIAAGRHPLPRDIMLRHGVSQNDLQSLKPTDELRHAIEELAGIASRILDEAGSARRREAAPVMLTAVLARAYLKRLASTGYDPFDERNMQPLNYRAWRLMGAVLARRF